MQVYAYLMRYGNMSIREIRDLDMETAIELFTQLCELIKKENGDSHGSSSISQNRFKPGNKL